MISGFNHVSLETANVPADVLSAITANKKPTIVEFNGSVYILTFDGEYWSSYNAKIENGEFVLGGGSSQPAESPFYELPEDIVDKINIKESLIEGLYSIFNAAYESGKPIKIRLSSGLFDGSSQGDSYGTYLMNTTKTEGGLSRSIALSCIGFMDGGFPSYEPKALSLVCTSDNTMELGIYTK